MIEGLSSSLDVTTELAKRYGVIFRKTELKDSELKYTLDHSSYFYLSARWLAPKWISWLTTLMPERWPQVQ